MFRCLSTAQAALEILLERCTPLERSENLPLSEACGRILSQNICSSVYLPEFNRAAMDGYAVKSIDTRGASQVAPIYLNLESECVSVRTGMKVPEGFDSVVMIEDTQVRGGDLEITAEVYPFKNVSKIGEDVAAGDLVLREGHCLRPPDLALLAALRIGEVQVYSRPRVSIIPTGSELVSIGSRALKCGEAYEINGLMTELYVNLWGGLAHKQKTVPDDPELIRISMEAQRGYDMIILLGGTSVGERDYVPALLAEMGELMVHGVKISPGKPTAIGVLGRAPVLCLPGYPVAALSALYLFARPAVKKMARLDGTVPTARARLARKITSRPGYLNLVRVALDGGSAEPVMSSGASILSSVARAKGFAIVPEESEGIEAGEEIEIWLIE